jgi:hypothetical protein
VSSDVQPRLAAAKAIGTDVESLVSGAVGGLALAVDEDAHHDAVATALLTPSTIAVYVPVLFATPLVERGTQTEIKACVRERSKGARNAPGSWCFKGRDDGQHAALIEDAAVYLLAVYAENGADRELVAIAVVPATIVDEHLQESWYDVDRREETIAQLAWSHVLGDRVGGDGD